MVLPTRKDTFLTLFAGALVAMLLLFVANNVAALSVLFQYKIQFLIGLPLLFFGGFFIAAWLSSFPKFSTLRQIVKFAIVGVVNTSVDFGVLNFLVTLTGIDKGLSLTILNGVSFIAAVTNSFFWNRLWVFEQEKNSFNVNQFAQFFLISIGAVLINSIIIYSLTTFVHISALDDRSWLNIAKIFATLLSMVWNFLGYKFFVFKQQR